MRKQNLGALIALVIAIIMTAACTNKQPEKITKFSNLIPIKVSGIDDSLCYSMDSMVVLSLNPTNPLQDNTYGKLYLYVSPKKEILGYYQSYYEKGWLDLADAKPSDIGWSMTNNEHRVILSAGAEQVAKLNQISYLVFKTKEARDTFFLTTDRWKKQL